MSDIIVFPLDTDQSNYRISSNYGIRINSKTGKKEVHKGIDIAVAVGTPVVAMKSGTITRLGWQDNENHDKGFGQRISILYDDGSVYEGYYGHLSGFVKELEERFKNGETVKVTAGQLIGYSGNNGASRGPHLHYEESYFKDGVKITQDPTSTIQQAQSNQSQTPSQITVNIDNYIQGFSDKVQEIKETIQTLIDDAADSSFIQTLQNAAEVVINNITESNTSYTIESGDTLSQIAANNGVTVEQLLEANPDITNPDQITAGDTINIPSITEDSFSIKDYIAGKISEVSSTISDALSSAYDQFLSAVNMVVRTDPLIIDMDGDGLELSSWQDSGVFFDLNGDGLKESTGWVVPESAGGDDVFLVIDKNGNDNIDNIEELFGNDSQSGFLQLKAFDSNHDNLINSTDNQFNLLKLWHDKDADGVVDVGELTDNTIIKEISLNAVNSTRLINGNVRAESAAITFNNGSTGAIHELWFGVNEFNSTDDQSSGADLNLQAILLPFSRGYGDLASWTEALSSDADLLVLAQELSSLAPNQFYRMEELFTDFLFKWSDVEDVTATEVYGWDYQGFDARKAAFLEKVTSLDYNLRNTASISFAKNSWNLFYDTLLSRFLVQSVFKDIFPNAVYDFATDQIEINNTLDEVIANITALSDSLDQNSFLNYAYYSENILNLNKDQFNDSDFDAKVQNMRNKLIDSVSIPGFNFDGIFNIGSGQSDVLYGSSNADIIKGLSSADNIYAASGNDYIEGGSGNDYLKGEEGNDFYYFNPGDGKDTIEDSSGYDSIMLGTGIDQSDLKFSGVGNDLIIDVGDNGDQIAIKDFYNNRVERIEFSNGTYYDLNSLGSILNGTGSDDVINGAGSNDIIDSFQKLLFITNDSNLLTFKSDICHFETHQNY